MEIQTPPSPELDWSEARIEAERRRIFAEVEAETRQDRARQQAKLED
jgi:hypothetical protein